jgi:hypothetical protein
VRVLFGGDVMHAIRHGLVDATRDYAGGDWAADVLAPWLRERPAFVGTVHRAGERGMHATALPAEDRWTLYALSRVTDRLLLGHQPPAADPAEDLVTTGPEAYAAFVAALDGWWPADAAYHPFLHEIVAVVPADDPDEPPTIVDTWWPGFLCGDLLMLRGGVTVRAGGRVLDPAVAARSPLYWTWLRRYRPTVDLSHGWGSNSQWRTSFRRDYLVAGACHYNVDGRGPRGGPEEELSQEELADLVRYRAGTTVDRGPDAWPFDTRVVDESPAVTR